VDRVVAGIGVDEPPAAKTGAARRAVDGARRKIRDGEEAPGLDAIVEDATRILARRRKALLAKVINATGVLIHTNLGRVPLGPTQLEAVHRVASGYSNLEFDLAAGKRGSRYDHAAGSIASLIGAEAALVVNNNAAAVLLTLAALCSGREVIISRGELVEIGGEFRIPDIMEAAGVTLVEVGTTNRTHIADYERAITPRTAAILKVHPSNYRVVGFAASVPAVDLARLGWGRGLLFIHDLGSGLLETSHVEPLVSQEPTVQNSIAEGVDLVTFSGDKLLGGPQAGVIAGRAELIRKLLRHPMLRALRVDKMTLAALEATVDAYARGTADQLPLWQMASQDGDALAERAMALGDEIRAALNDDYKIEASVSEAVFGGGSAPGEELVSWCVAVTHAKKSAAEIERSLLQAAVPVVPRVHGDRVLLDLRTISPRDEEILLASVTEALG
jgi:L-seryl-tRNA(Ser) seleniumtransferase